MGRWVSCFCCAVLAVFGGLACAESISAQIARGNDSYVMQCVECHGATLDGGRGPPLRGAPFLKHWNEKTARNLYSRILTTMPVSAPGSLEPSTVLDLTIFILKQNDLDVGPEAKSSAEMLNDIPIAH